MAPGARSGHPPRAPFVPGRCSHNPRLSPARRRRLRSITRSWAGAADSQEESPGDKQVTDSCTSCSKTPFLNLQLPLKPSRVGFGCRFGIGVAAMKDPSRSSTSPSIISEDVIINGHSHEDDNPFAEYMWMENEEEFNRQIEEELWEEEFIERCFQEMLEEEEEHEWFIPARDLPQTMDQIQDQFNDLVISDSSSLEDLVVKSNLNPNAKEFVPGVKYLNI